MRRNLLLSVLVFSLVFFFSKLGFAQTNDFTLQSVDLTLCPNPSGGTVEIDIMINTAVNNVVSVLAPLTVSGTAGAVLDTVLTGGLNSANPPAFLPPSLVSQFSSRIVNPYGPPMLFVAVDFQSGIALPMSGLFCKMFYKVTGPGTIVIDTMTHPIGGPLAMADLNGPIPVTWGGPYVFDVTQTPEQPPVVTCPSFLDKFVNDTISINISATDAGGTPIQGIFLDTISPAPCGSGSFISVSPEPGQDSCWVFSWNAACCPADLYSLTFGVYDDCETTYCSTQVKAQLRANGDVNCDRKVSVSDVVYLINYLFKGGPPPCQ